VGERWRIYRTLVGAQWRSQLQYRASFVLDIVTQALSSGLEFVTIAIIFANIPSLQDWSLAEVAFLYGVSGVTFALADLCFGSVDRFPSTIRLGTFDQILTRPVGTLLQVMAAEVPLRRLGRAMQSGTVLVIAIGGLDIAWTPGRVAMMGVMLAAGATIFSAINVLAAASVFWLTDTAEIGNAFSYGGAYLTSYPLSVFGDWFRRLVGFGVGLAFVNYFPSLYILDKADPLGFPRALQFASPVAAAAMAVVAGLTWRVAVRHYRSTGS
jgi:ABC-2 type transport system permease protein